MTSEAPQQPNCRACLHFHITYDPAKPYGCRAMGFKSRQNPAKVVFVSSGATCRAFQARKKS